MATHLHRFLTGGRKEMDRGMFRTVQEADRDLDSSERFELQLPRVAARDVRRSGRSSGSSQVPSARNTAEDRRSLPLQAYLHCRGTSACPDKAEPLSPERGHPEESETTAKLLQVNESLGKNAPRHSSPAVWQRTVR